MLLCPGYVRRGVTATLALPHSCMAARVDWRHSADIGEVDLCALLHSLHHTLWVAWGGLGGLAQQCSTAAQGARLVGLNLAKVKKAAR
jgi:hypothetical protein